jgi:hypothetical protein
MYHWQWKMQMIMIVIMIILVVMVVVDAAVSVAVAVTMAVPVNELIAYTKCKNILDNVNETSTELIQMSVVDRVDMKDMMNRHHRR